MPSTAPNRRSGPDERLDLGRAGPDRAGRRAADRVSTGGRSLRPFITIWTVRDGNDLYVRSAHGYDNPWFQRALHSGQGRIRSGGIERDVAFEEPGPEAVARVTAAYHAKYDRYGPAIVGTVVSPDAERSTLRLEAR